MEQLQWRGKVLPFPIPMRIQEPVIHDPWYERATEFVIENVSPGWAFMLSLSLCLAFAIALGTLV